MSEPHPTIRPQPGILDIALYQGGESRARRPRARPEAQLEREPVGPSPRAIEAFRDAAATLHLYPSSRPRGLRAAIAEVHGLDPARIVCGAGSDEIIAFLTQAYAGPGQRGHPHRARLRHVPDQRPRRRRDAGRGRARRAPHRRRRHPRRLQRTHRAGLHRQPQQPDRHDDPGGRGRAARRRAAARRRFSSSTAPMPSSSTGFDGHAGLVEARDNVVMTRTFSKIHGLGGLRVGWGYGPAHVIDVLNRVRGPVQPLDRRPRRRRGGDPRHRLDRAVPRREQPQPRRAGRGAGGDGVASRPVARPTSSSPASATRPRPRPADRALRDRGHHRPPGRRLQACRRRCASPSATPRPAPASPRRSATS